MKIFKSCEDGVHKYRARYDKKFNQDFVKNGLSMKGKFSIDDLKESIYIKDICVKCGKIIKREDI